MKHLLVITMVLLYPLLTWAGKTDSTALILIDIQDFYFEGGKMALSEPEKAELNAFKILKYFRENNGLVIHVKHDSEPGGKIRKMVEPQDNEKVYSKKKINIFADSDLNAYLKSKGIRKLVLCGMQTHMCLEAATRAGSDLGYKCTVISDACATRDLKLNEVTVKAADVHVSTLVTLKSYSTIIGTDDFLIER
jgi:nicotinamidase-related amidase